MNPQTEALQRKHDDIYSMLDELLTSEQHELLNELLELERELTLRES